MKLSNELDFKALAQEAGLTAEQAELFARGLEGQHTDTLDLAREPYTQLQTMFEKALMEVILSNPEVAFSDKEDKYRPPFLYRTQKLGTPVHNSEHPRADVIRSMVDAPIPAAALLCNSENLQVIGEMPHLQDISAQERLAQILSGQNRIIDPFSCNPKGASTNHSFMAMRFLGGLSPIQFEASQMAELKNQTPGRLVFGGEASDNYENGIIIHHLNRMCGRTNAFIKGIILGD